MSSRKRGQAGREGPRGREWNNLCYNKIVPTDMIFRIESVDNRDERDHGDENLKMAIIHVTKCRENVDKRDERDHGDEN